ncbi:MAG TPA: arginyltransferase [Pirellulaceae bacterium]|nr:arginyltransferase [Pirellulaceae bacterium]
MSVQEKSDIVVVDELEPCPYLPERVARMPLRLPIKSITPSEMDRLMEHGSRRTGEFIYRTHCPQCEACEAIRLNVAQFSPSASQRRALRRGDAIWRQQIGPLFADQQRVDLFNLHRRVRGLNRSDQDIDTDEYHWGFVRSCFLSFEMTYWHGDQLVMLAVCDRGERCLSAVYTFYDPRIRGHSLGTYSVLKQVEYCRQQNIDHLYLGYYIAESPAMRYKARFLPNERLQRGKWIRYDH